MKSFNFIINQFIRCVSGVNLNLSRYAAMVLVLLTLGIGNAWGSKNYYASLKITQSGPTGAGSVYVANGNTKPGSANPGTAVKSAATTTKSGNVTMYWWVDINPGYNVSLSGKVTGGPYSAASASGNVSCAASGTANETQAYTATATFVAVTVDKVNNSTSNTSLALDPTNPSTDYPFTVTFATSNLKTIAIDLDKSPETTDGKFTITSWAQDGSNVVATGKFNGGGSYGGASRNHSTTVSLQSKASGSTAKTCTVTANFPALAFVGVEATDVYATQGESGKTGSATFTYNYGAEDDFPTDPTLTPVSGTGALEITGYTVTPNFSDGTCEVTVDYTYDTNNGVGDTEATLILTAANGDARSVTITGHSEAAATNDASVTTTADVTTEYATFAEALAAANATSGATLTLLRNVDLGTITATKTVSKAMTIDLNGKELRAAVNKSEVPMLTFSASVTVKDSKTGGKIINEHALNGQLRTITVAGGTFTLESGTIAVHNSGQYASAANSTLGVAKYASCASRVIHQNAGTTVNITGSGKLDAKGTRSVYGIVQGSSAATNKAGTTVLNVTGGEIAVEAPYNALGIYAYGKVNMSAGVINTHITTDMVDAYYAADNANNTSNGYGYGIQMKVSVSATASSCYYGTLNMTGGTINVISDRTKATSLYNYGIYLEAAATGVGAGKTATDGTLSQKASAKASIENANITVHSNTYYSYGIIVYGSYNSYDNEYFTVPIKNCNIDVQAYLYTYAICANAAVNSTYGGCYWGDVELTGNTVTAESVTAHTAYAVLVSATTAHIFKDANTTTAPIYYGEYATAAKAVINSGTYTAKTKTTTAYAVCSSTRAKTIYDPETTVQTNRKPGGNAEAYPIVIIHGGTFRGEATTTTSRAVSSGGYTTIDGGTFEAFSTSTTAYGLYAVSGKLTASGVTISANATQYAYGAYADCVVPTNNTAQTGFAYAGEIELNNCDITATTRTSTEARGVVVNATNKNHNWTQFEKDKTSYSWSDATYNAYKSVFPCTVAGHDSVGIAIAAKATINGCDVKVTAGTTTAYGVYSTATSVPASADSVASPIVNIKNSKFTVKTDASTGSTTAIGVYAGGPTTIDGCDFTVQPKTTTAKGVYAYDKKTTITNTKFDVKATSEARLFYAEAAIGSTTGWDYHGEFELGEGNECVATATGGNTAHILTLIATKRNIASGRFAGDYANASSALVTGGSYKATATGTTCYAVNLSAEQVQGAVKAAPSCTIEGGKFWALASGGTTGICSTNGVAGNILFKGGVYNVNTTLSKHIPEGYEEVPLASDRPEYTEGYRYEVDKAGMHGIDVCQIGSTKYKSLEEALQVVTSGQVIYMIANYTMTTPGDYILPANTTLLIPYKTGSGAGATTAIGNSAKTTTSATTPSLFRKLTFGAGVNLTCFGTIETSAEQKANGQYGANVGMPSGAYGQIQMDEGSHISMESGSRLNCWGYITGKGTINVKNNATVLEGFQLGDWCGGTNATTLTGSSNKGKAFPITHYFYQSIECPITYRPGAKALGSTHVNMSFVGTVGQDAVPLVGTSDAMFIMDNVNASEDTWVMKDYDETTDYCYWTINSGASIGNLIVKIPNAIDVNSADYILPICSNMAVVLNYGEGYFGQHAVFTPGSKLIINKEGTLVLKNVNVSMLDLTEYTGATIYRATYSPTWGTTNPRSTSVNDAEVFVHGKIELKNNGGLYTSASGANIHSTNSDAGQVLYTSAAQGDKTTYYLKNAATSATAVTVNAAKLRNEDNTYSSTGGTAAGDVWVYVNGKWTKKTKEGCFSVETTDKKHYYIQPSDIVEVNYPAQSNHTYTSVTGNRVFVWDADCYWWEVETTPTAEGYFKAITPDHNGKYNYYYYDSSAACWKIKTITVTWNINGSNTNYSVGYGTKPEWLGATPTKTSSSSNYVWRWDGWTQGSSTEVLANDDLPEVTENTTFTAHFYEKYYEYNVTFKNSDGTILESKNWIAGTTPSYDGTPTKNPTVDYTYEFNGSWSPAITTVSGSATYVAQYDATPRAYTITFLNYDMSTLGTAEVVYNNTPSNATYLAAVAPLTEDPYKPDNSAFSFEFAGWRLQGASSNGFAQVKGDQTYIAQFNQTTKKYRIEFVDDDGETLLHWTQLEYGETPSYTWDNPANKQDVEWNYTFSGWTPEFTEVEGTQTYTAVYNKTKRKYDITWKDGNGNTLKTDQVAYGETPEYSGATPTKTSTNTHNYTFNNTWSPAIVDVEGEATYTAQFNETERKYRVTWDANGGTCATAYNDFSYDAAIGTLPVAGKEGHTFNGWFTSATGGTQITAATKVTADVIYHAQFTINTHSLTWDANGGELSGTYTSGTAIAYGTAIDVPTVSRANFVFNGWDATPASTMPDNDLTYTAQWTPAEASVTVEGEDPTYYATVAEAFTAAHGKTDPTVKILKEEVTIASEITISEAMTIDLNGNKITSNLASATGVFKINASGMTVTIMDSGTGGEIYHKASTSGTNYLYGVNITGGSMSVVSGKIYAENTGSSRAYGINTATNAKLVSVSGSAIIEAKSSSAFGIYTNNTCSLTVNGGTFTATGSESRGIYTKGTTELTNATITASGSDSRTIFAKDGNMTIHSGTYSATGTGSVYVIFFEAGKVTVKGGKFNGSTCEIAKRNTAYNVNLQGGVYVHETDLTAKCATNFYKFDLTAAEKAVVGNEYNYKVAEAYTITFKDGDDKTIQSGLVEKGQTPAYIGETPAKTATAQYTYAFNNTWSPALAPVEEGAQTYTAQFNSTVNKYTVTFKNGDVVLQSTEWEYGATPSYDGATPVSTGDDEKWAHPFTGWSPEISEVTANREYTAVYGDAITKMYPVVWKDWNGTILDDTTKGWGWPIPEYKGSTPTRETAHGMKYTFAGWKQLESEVEHGDVTFKARYSAETVENATPEEVINVAAEEEVDVVTMTVPTGTSLEIADGGSVEADVFIIQATTQDQEIISGVTAEVQVSGEMSETGLKNLGAIYYDLTRKGGTEPFLARVWYAVAVPWAVEVPNYANGGVFIKRGDDYIEQRLGTTFDLISYDGECRAKNGAGANCWVYLEDEIAAGTSQPVMVPGKLYMIYLTEETSTIRFKKADDDSPIHTNSLTVSAHTETSNSNDANWNGIANPATYRAYMNVNVGEGGLVQKFVPGTQPRDGGRYLPLYLTDKQAVGQPFFVQVDPTAGTSVVVTRNNNTPTLAPRRAQAEGDKEVRYAIGIAANGKLADRLYIQTAEEKEDKYVIGQDMSKMGISNYVAQMWVARYDVKLCLNTVAMARDKAVYPLGIYAPQAGEYMIFAPTDMEPGDNIYLTKDGRVIWNLTMAPYYATLEQGTTTNYGLRLIRSNAPAVTTGVDEVQSENAQCTKVIMDDHVYILRGEELYTITGQKAK